MVSERFEIVDLTPDDYTEVIDLISGYADLGLGFVDASSVVAIAVRLAVTATATLNHRDFAVVGPAHCGTAFDLVP